MKKRTPVSEIMTSQLHTINSTDSLHDAKRIIEEKEVRHVPVVSGAKMLGMISKTDLERVSFVSNYGSEQVATQMYDALTVEQVMTSEFQSVQKTDTILSVAQLLSKKEFHALPVMEGDELKGIVTTTDLLNYLIEQY